MGDLSFNYKLISEENDGFFFGNYRENKDWVWPHEGFVGPEANLDFSKRIYFTVDDLDVALLFLKGSGFLIVIGNDPNFVITVSELPGHTGKYASYNDRKIKLSTMWKGDDDYLHARHMCSYIHEAISIINIFFDNEAILTSMNVIASVDNDYLVKTIAEFRKMYGDVAEVILFKYCLENVL